MLKPAIFLPSIISGFRNPPLRECISPPQLGALAPSALVSEEGGLCGQARVAVGHGCPAPARLSDVEGVCRGVPL